MSHYPATMLRGLALSAIALLSSCVHERGVKLSALRSQRLTVIVSDESTDVEVWLSRWIPPGAHHDFEEPCPVLEDRVSATLDGVPMKATSRGGYVPSGGGPFDPSPAYCGRPTFKITTTASPAATSEIRITDGTTTFRAVIRRLRTVRRFAIAGALRQGEEAHLVWSVASDERWPAAPSLDATWTPDHGKGFSIWVPNTRPEGNTVVLSVPADATPGPGKLSVSAGFVPAVAACEGIARCDAALSGGQPLRATLVPAAAE